MDVVIRVIGIWMCSYNPSVMSYGFSMMRNCEPVDYMTMEQAKLMNSCIIRMTPVRWHQLE